MHSRKALRLRGFDYASENLYLVTACTYERRCILGSIIEDAVVLSPFGEVVKQQVKLLPKRMLGVGVDAFVVMPNHIHAIVALTRARQASPLRLGHVIGAVKSGSARAINHMRGTPGASVWQRGYHDHVIRDEHDLRRVREYIASNPIRWALDPDNPARIA